MMVEVRLFGYLRDRGRGESRQGREFQMILPEESTVRDLLSLLEIPGRELMLVINPGEKEKVLIIDKSQDAWEKTALKENDKTWIYPFLDGG